MAQQYQPALQTSTKGNGFGVTALVLGIISLVLAVIPILGFVAFVLGPLAVIFGIVGVVQAHRPKGMAITGMVLGAISLVVAVFITTAFFGAIGSASEEAQSVAPPAASGSPADPAAEVVKIEATQILEEFAANEAAADQKYAGKALEVTGSVDKVDTEIFEDTKYVVRLNDGSDFSFATVNCNDVPTDEAAAVVADSTVTIRGLFDDGGDLGVEIKDCVVL